MLEYEVATLGVLLGEPIAEGTSVRILPEERTVPAKDREQCRNLEIFETRDRSGAGY